MRRALVIIVIAAVQSFATLACGIGRVTTSGFLWNRPAPAHRVLGKVLDILELPLLTLVRRLDAQDQSVYLPVMILNSLLWGAIIYLGIAAVKGRAGGKAS